MQPHNAALTGLERLAIGAIDCAKGCMLKRRVAQQSCFLHAQKHLLEVHFLARIDDIENVVWLIRIQTVHDGREVCCTVAIATIAVAQHQRGKLLIFL